MSLVVVVVVLAALRDRFDAVDEAAGWPHAGALGVAVLANLVGNAVLAWTWRDVVTAAGTRLPSGRAAWIWASSQLSRYLVGGAQVAGRAVVAARHGVTLTTGGATALVEVALAFCVASAVALATAPSWLPDASGVGWLALVAVLPTALFVALVVAPARTTTVLAGLVARLPGRIGRLGQAAGRRVPSSMFLTGVAGRMLANFGIRVAGFAVLVAAGADGAGAGRILGAYAVGQVAGRVAIFAPGGVGPREGATALVLAPVTGMGGAVALIAAARLVEVAAEVVFLVIAWSWQRREPGSDVVEVGPRQPPGTAGVLEVGVLEGDHPEGEASG